MTIEDNYSSISKSVLFVGVPCHSDSHSLTHHLFKSNYTLVSVLILKKIINIRNYPE